ncbi:FAD-dependent oxidoreductase [Mucilaginibacter sp. X5P1]|uniref:FAD-dependent oxidoreductase n=1 Tax=Mucilaginibacter sp. X5P1 TaxID=2723088 RepID=UPI00160BB2C9|nr:FAD-dependent monooxygenase [Mucilaginibacter sp. X5P1]MBB6137246.1 2-polyprenyl-6-methoxyphenol hydroxylase-like FAD-dependent oxidoreductase [Mucilaginibacter sp. X5P1]
MENEKVIIAGGGMAGLTLALFLKKAGIPVAVYEAYPEFKNSGLSFTIAPNGMQVLAELGLSTAIIKSGNIISAFEFKNAGGGRIARIRTGHGEQYGQPSVMISRYTLHKALYGAALAQGIAVNYGKKLIAINERGEMVTALFEDGTQVNGALLIGADGIHSATRQLIFPDAPKPAYVGFYGTGGILDIKDINNDETLNKGDLTLVYGNAGFFGYGFDKPDEILWWSSLEVPENEVKSFVTNNTDDQIRNRLLDLFADYHHPVKELVAKTKQFAQTISYQIAPLDGWHKGRVILIGDAGHALSTTSGQGASMAFEDAMFLAKLFKDNGIANYQQIFKLFEAERMPRLKKFFEAAKRGNSDKKVTGTFGLFIKEKMMAFFIGLFGEKGLKWQYSYKINWNK